MTVEHDPSAAYDDVNVPSIALVAGVGAVLVFVSIVAVQVIYFRYRQSEYEQKVLAVPTTSQNQVLADQHKRIDTGTLAADAPATEKGVPIKEAMSLVLADYKKKRSADENKAGGQPQSGAESDEKKNEEKQDGRPADEKSRPE